GPSTVGLSATLGSCVHGLVVRASAAHRWGLMKTVPFDEIARLSNALLRARRFLAGESPYGPAWAATCELVAELEAGMRARGLDPDAPVRCKRAAGTFSGLFAHGRVA